MITQAEKERIKNWYRSMKEVLKANGADVDNRADAMRVRVYNGKNFDRFPGFFFQQEAGRMEYAFMKRNPGAREGELGTYEVPAPEYSKDEQKAFMDAVEKNERNNTRYQLHLGMLQEARRKKEPITRQRELAATLKAKFEDAEKGYLNNEVMINEFFRARSKWSIENQKVFDPDAEEDFTQIEGLYRKAMNGQLILQPAGENAQDFRQILVGKDGTAILGSTQAEINEKLDARNSNRGVFTVGYMSEVGIAPRVQKDNFKLVFEMDAEALPRPKMLPELPKKPAEVPKPGILSWLKFIFSFGKNLDDYIKYELYLGRMDAYNRVLQEYKQEEVGHAYSEYNQALEKDYEDLANKMNKKEYELLYENRIENPARIYSTMEQMAQAVTGMWDYYEDWKIYNTVYKTKCMANEINTQVELRENPGSFDESFNRITGESEKYWRTRYENRPEAQHIKQVLQQVKELSDRCDEVKKELESVKEKEAVPEAEPQAAGPAGPVIK